MRTMAELKADVVNASNVAKSLKPTYLLAVTNAKRLRDQMRAYNLDLQAARLAYNQAKYIAAKVVEEPVGELLAELAPMQ